MFVAQQFISSWQLFPEKGTYEIGHRPKAAIYRISHGQQRDSIAVHMNRQTIEDQAFTSSFEVTVDGENRTYSDTEFAEQVKASLVHDLELVISFLKNSEVFLEVKHEITPKGYLRVTESHRTQHGNRVNVEIYHKQLSMLPYAASVSGAVIKPTEEGLIRHHALTAMEEQTNMQLMQIRQQIELLAIQAKEIQNRKELSAIIYNARLGFSPVIGQTYYLYEKADGEHLLSLVSPKEWGARIPFKAFVARVKLLADHTWTEE